MDLELEKKLLTNQEISKVLLSKILSVNPNTKHLILQSKLIKPLERVCGIKWLKGNGVDKIFKLENFNVSFEANAIFYMIYSSVDVFKKVVDQIRSKVNVETPTKNKFHIIVIPRYLHFFEKELEELGLLYSHIKLHSFQWLPLYLDTNILTLELPHVFRQIFVRQDVTLLYAFAKCIWQMFFAFGKPKFIISIGELANGVLDLYDNLCENKGDTDKFYCDFGGLLILDRNVDYATPLLTPSVYSALLKEVYDVNVASIEHKEGDSSIKFDSLFNPITQKQSVSISLNSKEDIIYKVIKNKYFPDVTQMLCLLTKELKTEKANSKEMDLAEIKKYVQTQLGMTNSRKRFITSHILASETILGVLGSRFENQCEVEYNLLKNTNKSENLNYLEQGITTENNALLSLRLFCLMCLTQKLNENEVNTFWKKYLQNFGYNHSGALQSIRSLGILPESTQNAFNISSKLIKLPKFNSSQFYANATKFKQIPLDREKIDLKYPTCPSYVFKGSYIPLITQIASLVLNSTPLEEIKLKLESLGPVKIRNERAYPLQRRTLLIFVIGGITYAEVAACNLLEALTGTKIVLLSDKVVSGNDLVREILKSSSNCS